MRFAWGVFVLVIAAAGAASAAPFAPLRTIAEILTFDAAELGRERPVVVRGTLTFQRDFSAVIQEGDDAIFVSASGVPGHYDSINWPRIPLGSVIEVAGVVTPGGYAPSIRASSIREIEPGQLPPAVPVDLGRLFTGADDNRRVMVTGIVQGRANVEPSSSWSLILETASRRLMVELAREIFPDPPDGLVDAEVRVTGAAAAFRNTRGEFIAPRVAVARPDDLVVLVPSRGPPFDARKVPLGGIARYRLDRVGGHRLRTEGVVTFVSEGSLFLQEGRGGVRVDLAPDAGERPAFRPGDRVEVAGFLDMTRRIGGLVGAVARRIDTAPPPPPLDISPAEIVAENAAALRSGQIAGSGGYDGCLIRCRAVVDAVNSLPEGAVVLLSDKGTSLAAELPHGASAAGLVARLAPGSEVKLTGIVQLDIAAPMVGGLTVAHPALERLSLIVRSPDDIVVLRSPPWWTPRRLAVATGMLAAVSAAAIGWVAVLRREVTRQTALAVAEATGRRKAAIEYEAALRERGRIAADLHDTLLQTMTGIGYKLQMCRAGLDGASPKAVGQVEAAERLVEHATRQLRGTVWSLRSMPYENKPLAEALAELVRVIGEEHEMPIGFHEAGSGSPVDEAVARELLLVVQEALLNALYHAKPRRIDVALTASGDELSVRVGDDGVGFEVGRRPGLESGHFGMQGMQERVARLGGSWQVASAPGAGTTVTVRVPNQHLEGKRS